MHLLILDGLLYVIVLLHEFLPTKYGSFYITLHVYCHFVSILNMH